MIWIDLIGGTVTAALVIALLALGAPVPALVLAASTIVGRVRLQSTLKRDRDEQPPGA